MTAGALILAIDPGTQKCGVALVRVDTPPTTIYRVVVPTPELLDMIREILAGHAVETVLIGNATYGKTVEKTVRPLLPDRMPLYFVKEAYTSERAKRRWCEENPPRNLLERLLPGCRTPTEPIDDYAAVILAEDWLTEN